MAVLFLIFLDHICPKWIKLDQNGFLTNQKVFLLKVFKFAKRITMAVLFWIFLDEICPKLIKLVQTWSNLIKLDFSPIKKCDYKKFSHLQKGQRGLFYFWFFWIRSVQNGSNLIKLDQIGFLTNQKMLL